jgi:hypothetical protein
VKKQSQSKPISRSHTAGKGAKSEEMVVDMLLINPIMAIYKSTNERYYTLNIRRCSSMVEHSFRKAGVEGSTPSIGFGGPAFQGLFCIYHSTMDKSIYQSNWGQ